MASELGPQRVAKVRSRAQQIRDERAARAAELNGEDPSSGATLEEGPVVEDDSVIARADALSAFVPEDEKNGARTVEREVYSSVENDLMDLGRELGGQVEERLTEFRDELAESVRQIEGGGTVAGPKGFIYGAGFGAAVFGLGVAVALAALRSSSPRTRS